MINTPCFYNSTNSTIMSYIKPFYTSQVSRAGVLGSLGGFFLPFRLGADGVTIIGSQGGAGACPVFGMPTILTPSKTRIQPTEIVLAFRPLSGVWFRCRNHYYGSFR